MRLCIELSCCCCCCGWTKGQEWHFGIDNNVKRGWKTWQFFKFSSTLPLMAIKMRTSIRSRSTRKRYYFISGYFPIEKPFFIFLVKSINFKVDAYWNKSRWFAVTVAVSLFMGETNIKKFWGDFDVINEISLIKFNTKTVWMSRRAKRLCDTVLCYARL